MPWDGVYAMATPGRVFDMFTNQGHALRGRGERRPGGSLMLFAGAHRAAALAGERDAVIAERFLADLATLYPGARDVIADAHVHRWPLGNVYAHPGRARLQAPLEGALGPARNLHLAGDYFAELGNLEAAARTGVAAAERAGVRPRRNPCRTTPTERACPTSTESSRPSSRRSPRTASASTATRSPPSSSASSAPASAGSCPAAAPASSRP